MKSQRLKRRDRRQWPKLVIIRNFFICLAPVKSTESAKVKAPKDLGPLPKAAPSAYTIFFSENNTRVKNEHAGCKQAEVMGLVGKEWAALDAEAKKEYEKKAEIQKKLTEARLEERKKNGFFTFEDGTKSTDPKNKDKVKKEKP